jgi:hypothetical protein
LDHFLLQNTAMLTRSILAAALASGVVFGCAGEGERTRRPCIGAKCDLPGGEPAEQCVLRRQDAFNDNQIAFTKTALRWSCADVDGVSGIDRGQEYCEYFSVIQLPAEAAGGVEPEPAVLGRLIRIESDDPDDPNAEAIEQTPIGVDLSANQIYELEADPTAVVGQCIFTSWNNDYEEWPEQCYEDGCPQVMGLDVEPENFRMKLDANTADAAQALTEDCFAMEKIGDLDDDQDPLHDDFFRGCMINSDVNETSYRKSDSTVCAAINRLSECGCELTNVDPQTTLADAISPWERRGFPLGTWADQKALPAGCRYVDTGDGSNTIVECELTADDVLLYARDPKNLCRSRYAANVVVHVPINPSQISCAPQSSTNPYADSCSAAPWILEEGPTSEGAY